MTSSQNAGLVGKIQDGEGLRFVREIPINGNLDTISSNGIGSFYKIPVPKGEISPYCDIYVKIVHSKGGLPKLLFFEGMQNGQHQDLASSATYLQENKFYRLPPSSNNVYIRLD